MSLLLDRSSPQAPEPRHSRGSRRVPTLVVLLAALVGGAAGAAVLAATGALDTRGSSATTTIYRSAPGTASGLNAGLVYARAAGGVVDITARGMAVAQGPFGEPQSRQTTATGSGSVLDTSGHILTASHVVDAATSITVALPDGSSRKATVLGRDDATDIAVLKIDPAGLTLHPLSLGSSAAVGIGDPVAAIGDPFSYDRSISTGIVSGLDRTIEAPNGFTVAHALQTDAALNPGNSGGPLLDSAGRVIGVVDQIATGGSAEQSSGVGFAIPIDLVAKELPNLIAGRAIRHAYLGASLSTATGSIPGALIGALSANGPGARAGLKAGDVVTAIDATAVKDTGDLVAAIAAHNPGDRVTLTVRRGSSTERLTVTLGVQPTQRTTQSG